MFSFVGSDAENCQDNITSSYDMKSFIAFGADLPDGVGRGARVEGGLLDRKKRIDKRAQYVTKCNLWHYLQYDLKLATGN